MSAGHASQDVLPWAAVPPERGWLLLTGAALIAGGLIWLARGGADASAIFAAPGPSAAGGPATWPVGFAVLPGLWCVLLWLRGAFGLRRLLGRACVATARVEFQQSMPLLAPGRRLVGYRFADRGGGEHRGRQWVRAASPEGRCVHAGGRDLVALYDPDRPHRCRLVAAERLLARSRPLPP